MSSAKKNNTFRFPFDINPKVFIVLAVVFFIFSIKPVSEYLMPKITVERLSSKIEEDIISQISLFKKMGNSPSVFDYAINNSLSVLQHENVLRLPVKFHLYDRGKLVFWNSAVLNGLADTLIPDRPVYHKSKNGHYVLYRSDWGQQNGYQAVLIIPVKNENLFQSTYMKDYFYVYPDENESGIHIRKDSSMNATAVRWSGAPLFYLTTADDYFSQADSNLRHLLYNALTFIFFGISIHTYFKVIVKKKKPIRIFLLLLGSAILFRVLTYFTGFPNDFSEYKLFSPEFFATNNINKSIGDVFINVCLCFWVFLFFSVNVQGKITTLSSAYKKYVFGVFVMFICVLLHLYFIDLIYSIVLDSVINFDATLISKFNMFSFFGLLSFLVIFANLFLISYISNNYANSCFPKKWIKYILLVVITLLYQFFINNEHHLTVTSYILWAAAVFLILDFTASRIRFDFNSIYLLIWIVMVSFFGSNLLTELNIKKEQINRKKFAENITKDRDIQLERKLIVFKSKLQSDEMLMSKLSSDTAINYFGISDHIYIHYFDSYINKYKFSFNLFDSTGRNLNLFDTISLSSFLKTAANAAPLTSDSLITFKKEHEAYYYYVVCPVVKNGKLLGTFAYTFYEKLSVFDDENTDFIVYDGLKSEFRDYQYSMAVYENGSIISRKGLYSFESKIDTAEINRRGHFYFENKNGNNEMWYRFPEIKHTVVIVKQSNRGIMLSTLFAYIFLIYFSTISLYILGNIVARSNLNTKRFFNLLSLNLRLKIQLSILFVVFTSFIVIGFLTSRYLSNRIREKARMDISDYAQVIQSDLLQYFHNSKVDSVFVKSNLLQSGVIGSLEKLSKRFDVNLSLFNLDDGSLVYSSKPDLFLSGVFSNLVPQRAYYELKVNNREHVIQPESIGDFNYIASYSFIRDSAGTPIAILQLPYLFSNFEITNETNSVIVTIVNMYVFVFLISSMLALFISNSVSRPFKFIVKQFTQINLAKTNEPLKWNSSDEIGMLVKEYNRMLRKLENSTVLLAKNEREMAWREMAKQVAHEIKNPLTPMKLSLQMLERAIKSNKPNVEEMTSRVTKTIIEQIDNLTIIATNFSSFAKLPEIKKEVIVLNEVLYSVTGMYNDSSQFEYLFLIPDYPIHIFADKGQLIRVFTNIIQNAIQAIPEGSKGHISLLVSKIKNNYVRISISDNGEGITKEKGKKLFQPYFTTKTSGTGLGLAMCRDIVEQFEGKIEYESIIREGTTFHIDLPLVEDDLHSADEAIF